MGVNMEFSLKEALISIRREKLMSLTATMIIYVSLVMFGMFLILLFNFNSLMENLSDKMEIRAYIAENFPKSGVENLKPKIYQVIGVNKVTFISKEQAWQDFKKSFSNINLGSTLEDNPLLDSFQVKADNIEIIPQVSSAIEKLPGIDDVRYGGEIAERIQIFNKIFFMVGWGIVGILLTITLLIVVNTIRLTVLARKNEIFIMQLVGATRSFIRWPFILEGIILGILGAAMAGLSLKFSYGFLAAKLNANLPFLPISFEVSSINLIYFSIFVLGVLLGGVGASISVSQSIKLTQT